MRNPFVELIELLPSYPLQVGTVSAFSDGVCTLTLPGGGVIQARGTAGIGDKVFFRDGVIEGSAPSLPVELIDV